MGGVGGTTPPTLNLTLGASGGFAPFVPGIASNYTTTVTAQVLSMALHATLSVADPSATQMGHLVNGAFALAAPLEIAGTRPPAEGQPPAAPVFAAVGGTANLTSLLSYACPVNETETLPSGSRSIRPRRCARAPTARR